MQFYLAIDPASIPSAQQKKICVRYGRTFVYTDSRVKQARMNMVNCIINAVKGEKLDAKAYCLAIEYVYRSATLKKADRGKAKVTRPDLDNISKLVVDAITDSHVAWADDGAVSTMIFRKRNAREDEEVPYVFVSIEEDIIEQPVGIAKEHHKSV